MRNNRNVNAVSDLAPVVTYVLSQNHKVVAEAISRRVYRIAGSRAAASQIGPRAMGEQDWDRVSKKGLMPSFENFLQVIRTLELQGVIVLRRFGNDAVYEYIPLGNNTNRQGIVPILQKISQTYGAATADLAQFQAEQIGEMSCSSSCVSWPFLARFFAAGGFEMLVELRAKTPAKTVRLL